MASPSWRTYAVTACFIIIHARSIDQPGDEVGQTETEKDMNHEDDDDEEEEEKGPDPAQAEEEEGDPAPAENGEMNLDEEGEGQAQEEEMVVEENVMCRRSISSGSRGGGGGSTVSFADFRKKIDIPPLIELYVQKALHSSESIIWDFIFVLFLIRPLSYSSYFRDWGE